jgi:hypothetical protein
MLGGLPFGANPLKLMFGEAVDLADGVRWHLTLRFGLFAVGKRTKSSGKLSRTPWVAFKFPGVPLLHALFWVAQRPSVLSR